MLQSLSSRVRSVERSPIRKLFDKIKKTQNVIGLHVGEPNFDTPEHIKNAAKKALVDGFTHYTHSAGLIELRQAIAEKILKENNIRIRDIEARCKNPKYLRKILKRLSEKPSSYEKKISSLCVDYNLPFIYTGDGTFLIGRKNPDFKHESLPIVIKGLS